MPLTLTALRRNLEDMDAPELRGVIETLFKANTANKNLLTALLNNDASELRAKAEAEIARAFSLGKRRPTLKTSGARAAIAAYAKVASPLEVLTLQLQFVQAGMECWNRFGGPDSLLDSLSSMWEAALKRAGELPSDTLPWAQLEAVNSLLTDFGMGGLEALEQFSELRHRKKRLSVAPFSILLDQIHSLRSVIMMTNALDEELDEDGGGS